MAIANNAVTRDQFAHICRNLDHMKWENQRLLLDQASTPELLMLSIKVQRYSDRFGAVLKVEQDLVMEQAILAA